MGNLAAILISLERLAEAEPLLRESLDLSRQTYPDGHPATAVSLINLAKVLNDRNQSSEAETLCREAVQLLREHLPGGDRLGIALEQLAMSLRAQDKLAEAGPLFRESLEIQRSSEPEPSPQLGYALATYAEVLLELQAWSEAEAPARDCLALRQDLDPDGWQTFESMALLGGALLGQDKLDEAEPLLLEAYRGLQQRAASIPSKGTVHITEALERLVQLYEARDDATEAATWRTELEAERAKQSNLSVDGDE